MPPSQGGQGRCAWVPPQTESKIMIAVYKSDFLNGKSNWSLLPAYTSIIYVAVIVIMCASWQRLYFTCTQQVIMDVHV